MSSVIEILRDLIAIPSVNPVLDSSGAGETRVAEYIADRAYVAGLQITRQPVFEGRENLVLHLDAGLEKTLLFEAHMDTVPAGKMERPFEPREEQGRLYGRGSCDTKATLAGMLTAMEYAAAHPAGLNCNLMMCCAVDEEHGATGIYRFVESGFNVDGAVVGEPTELRIVRAHKGVARFSVSAKGKAAHSSVPHEGKSAILLMARVLDFIRNEYEPRLEAMNHALCGRPTIAIGTIHGGQAINIVPDHCEIQIDRRLIPGENAQHVFQAFTEDLAFYLGDEARDVSIRPLLLDPPLNTPSGSNIVTAARAVAAEMKLGDEPYGVPFGSDGSKLEHILGVPTIVFGPGSIALAHTDAEYVPLDEVELAAKFYRKLALEFGNCQESTP